MPTLPVRTEKLKIYFIFRLPIFPNGCIMRMVLRWPSCPKACRLRSLARRCIVRRVLNMRKLSKHDRFLSSKIGEKNGPGRN